MNKTKLALVSATVATLQDLATVGMRQHNSSLYFAMPVDVAPTTYGDTLRELLDAGAGVKVLAGEHVYTLAVAPDNTVVWSKRASRISRRQHTTIQVQL